MNRNDQTNERKRPFFNPLACTLGVLGGLALGACFAEPGADGDEMCERGTEDCECSAEDTCLEGLVCDGGFCMASGDGDGDGDGDGSGDGDGDGAGGLGIENDGE